jgi:hypothetical protein
MVHEALETALVASNITVNRTILGYTTNCGSYPEFGQSLSWLTRSAWDLEQRGVALPTAIDLGPAGSAHALLVSAGGESRVVAPLYILYVSSDSSMPNGHPDVVEWVNVTGLDSSLLTSGGRLGFRTAAYGTGSSCSSCVLVAATEPGAMVSGVVSGAVHLLEIDAARLLTVSQRLLHELGENVAFGLFNGNPRPKSRQVAPARIGTPVIYRQHLIGNVDSSCLHAWNWDSLPLVITSIGLSSTPMQLLLDRETMCPPA